MKLTSNSIVFSFFIAAFVLLSCNNNKEPSKDNPAPTSNDYTYIYGFTDASMPPQYHRSYTIWVAPKLVSLTVDSYGNILLRDSSVLSETDYTNFVNSIRKLDIRNKKTGEAEGCTGGTSHNLDLYSASGEQIRGHIYNCGGKSYGDLAGDVEAAAQLFKGMIPDLSSKIDSTRKE